MKATPRDGGWPGDPRSLKEESRVRISTVHLAGDGAICGDFGMAKVFVYLAAHVQDGETLPEHLDRLIERVMFQVRADIHRGLPDRRYLRLVAAHTSYGKVSTAPQEVVVCLPGTLKSFSFDIKVSDDG